MKILSVNAGSSSLKFSLFDMEKEMAIATGLFERIGLEGSRYTIKYDDTKVEQEIALPDHSVAAEILLDVLIRLGILSSLEEIDGIGHRIVHGGDLYTKSVFITDKVIQDLEDIKDFAPLHNPAHVMGIRAFKKVLPNVPMVAVFDTAFHQTMDPVSYLYAIPYEWYEKYRIRKYGFHGTSHRYIAEMLAEKLGKKDLRIISCHLGNGGSVTAIRAGECVDTSMGFTPLTGIMMGTRTGDVDPSIIPYLMEKEGKNASEVLDDFNKRSGLLGVSETSSDMRDLIQGSMEGNEKCQLAMDKYVRSVVNYIAQYYFLLKGVDVISFTAGIGENSIPVRLKILEELAFLGIKVDVEKNNTRGEFQKISTKDSKILVYVVPTNEEWMIARDTVAFANR